jgi:hypothetical protein
MRVQFASEAIDGDLSRQGEVRRGPEDLSEEGLRVHAVCGNQAIGQLACATMFD